jgi:hypothetical protein
VKPTAASESVTAARPRKRSVDSEVRTAVGLEDVGGPEGYEVAAHIGDVAPRLKAAEELKGAEGLEPGS